MTQRLVLIEGRKSTAIVRCSCGEVFKAPGGMDAEKKQFDHMIKKSRGQ